jgi:hypothetical protein
LRVLNEARAEFAQRRGYSGAQTLERTLADLRPLKTPALQPTTGHTADARRGPTGMRHEKEGREVRIEAFLEDALEIDLDISGPRKRRVVS